LKLFTIGDSISQGFMSLAAARTDLCYSTLIAQALGLKTGSRREHNADYFYPEWKENGLPVNLEKIMRALNKQYGVSINGFKWITVARRINEVLDKSEDYYERGEGKEDQPYFGCLDYFHNISVRGFDIADSWLVTPEICKKQIAMADKKSKNDGFLTGANSALLRTALKVLSPKLDKNFSQLDWLEHHSSTQGVDNLILWLGANNVLGTIFTLDIKQTPNNSTKRPYKYSHIKRKALCWNLWHPEDFEAEYKELLNRVDTIMEKNKSRHWNVFIGTIPLVTIAPLAKGMGSPIHVPDRGIYYEHYTYFPFNEYFVHRAGRQLTAQQAIHIDNCIIAYNQTINALISQKNQLHLNRSGRSPYHVVDICKALNNMAWKRNNGQPPYQFPDFFNHINPQVDTKYYHADSEGRFCEGGIFSLDGIHPTAIGQGIIAHEFMKVMQSAGISFSNSLNWKAIFESDELYNSPISLMPAIYDTAHLAQHIVDFIQLFRS
jgi:hypothetical protein